MAMPYPDHLAWHLLVDIWAVPSGRRYMLSKATVVRWLMDTIRRQVAMETLAEPVILYAQGKERAWSSGVTAILPLTDSHMSSHALEEMGWMHYDLFSCQDFDWRAVQKRLWQAYGGHGRAVLLDRSDPSKSLAGMVVGEMRW